MPDELSTLTVNHCGPSRVSVNGGNEDDAVGNCGEVKGESPGNGVLLFCPRTTTAEGTVA
jgi:hypothetical protein